MRCVAFCSVIALGVSLVSGPLTASGWWCHPYEPPCYLPFDDQHRCASPTYGPWCQPCQSAYMQGNYNNGVNGPGCAPYMPCQPNVPGRACSGPCGTVPSPPGGAPPGYGPGSCCPLDWWGCSSCCKPCQPAVFAYVGPRASYLKIQSGVLVNAINDANGTVTTDIQTARQQATMAGVQTGIWYRAAGKIFEQLDGYWEKGDPHTRQLVQRTRTWQRYEVTGRLGATAGIGCFCTVLATPYAGYGFRWFEDTFHSQTFTFPDLDPAVTVVKPEVRFTYMTYYVPLGGIITLNMGCLEVGVLAEYQTTVQTLLKVQVNHSNDQTLAATRWRVPRQASWLVEVPVRAKLGPCCVQLEIGIVPFYKNEQYGALAVTDFFNSSDSLVSIPSRRQITAGARLELGLRI